MMFIKTMHLIHGEVGTIVRAVSDSFTRRNQMLITYIAIAVSALLGSVIAWDEVKSVAKPTKPAKES